MKNSLIDYLNGASGNDSEHLYTLMSNLGVNELAQRIHQYHTPMIEGFILNDEVNADEFFRFIESLPAGVVIASELVAQLLEQQRPGEPSDRRIPLVAGYSHELLSPAGVAKVTRLINWVIEHANPSSGIVYERPGYSMIRQQANEALKNNRPLSLTSYFFGPDSSVKKGWELIMAISTPGDAPKHAFYLGAQVFKKYFDLRSNADIDPDQALNTFKHDLMALRELNIAALSAEPHLQHRNIYPVLMTIELDLSEAEKTFFSPWYTAVGQAICTHLERPSVAKLHFLQLRNGLLGEVPRMCLGFSKVLHDDALICNIHTILMANVIKSDGHLKSSNPDEREALISQVEMGVDWKQLLKIVGKTGEKTLINYFGYRESYGSSLSSTGKRNALVSDLDI
jgi:hypothetical protein